ncbi:MAG TPA: hypothetical protein VJ481_03525 [Patescibacteria group bacterium]|uniref:Asl1-like glycosyl hydrolase catalytic domain-containing protein n=1 Tax=Candidatus Woesebacteria bacterium RBG_13_46_13 TaxID=1802479 RepID=A0A1F7X5J0_9BACT|nr:MAG: hypothetical protein A2Y68_03375 [Candidatus Woesebacteria bacterium RBG_13_46_13]HJX59597.1 hypothetical protein [Patescibacteria group bacterium]
MKKLLTSLFVSICFLLFGSRIAAAYDLASVANNRFGIHIIDSNDLEDAAKLVNSSGGDWGYVTLVIQQTDKNKDKWQDTFNKARRLHLIPIVRIATRPLGDIWEKPSLGEIDGWVSFLNSLNWVVKNRYVVIANEPNHTKEWGGEINPEEYATYLREFSSKLKGASSDFFVLPAGLDASAGNSKDTMDEATFIKKMLAKEPQVFANVDGWASHSYPNPDFSGSQNGYGRGSVRTYDWELSLLKELGIAKELPVFITETGWAHAMNGEKKKAISTDIIGERLSFAFTQVWTDKKIIAVTPFLLSYNEPPFDTFSWKDKEGFFYPFYFEVASLNKVKGEPVQEEKAEIESVIVQPFRLTGSIISGTLLVKNTGQSIWNKSDIGLISQEESALGISPSFETLEPGSIGFISFKILAPEESGVQLKSLTLTKGGNAISSPEFFQLFIVSPPRMKIDGFFATILKLIKGL